MHCWMLISYARCQTMDAIHKAKPTRASAIFISTRHYNSLMTKSSLLDRLVPTWVGAEWGRVPEPGPHANSWMPGVLRQDFESTPLLKTYLENVLLRSAPDLRLIGAQAWWSAFLHVPGSPNTVAVGCLPEKLGPLLCVRTSIRSILCFPYRGLHPESCAWIMFPCN